VTNPGSVALPTFLVVALHTAPSVGLSLWWWLITTSGISAVPLLHVCLDVCAGRYTDQHLRRREQRLISLSVGLVGTGTTLAVLVLLHSSRALQAPVTAVVVGVVVALAITHGLRWKISLHLGGMAGAVTVFVLLWGWPALLLTPLVGWAYWQLRAHTWPRQ
jgi:hypothetical protein